MAPHRRPRDARGNAAARRARKLWLLQEFGNGTEAQCSEPGCELLLTFETVTVDRFPILGVDGGSYRRGNIRPMCEPHNSGAGNVIRWGRVRAARALADLAALSRAGRPVDLLGGAVRPSPGLGVLRVPL